MTWDGSERRSSDIVMRSLLESLSEVKENQRKICERLDTIEKSVSMAEGAWWLAKYVIAPLMVGIASIGAYIIGLFDSHKL